MTSPETHFMARAASQKRLLDAGAFYKNKKGIRETPEALSLLMFPGLETRKAGHDYMSCLRNIQGDPGQLLVSVADGHGDNGHLHSYVATRLLANMLVHCWSLFKMHLKCGHSEDKIASLCHYCYQSVQDQMTQGLFPSLDIYSGTTMAMALIVMVDDRRYLIATNAGDSQIIWSDGKNSCLECSVDHNCDNMEVVQQYVTRLARERSKLKKEIEKFRQPDGDSIFLQRERTRLGKQLLNLEPKPVYYSRINCSSIVWDFPEFRDKRGRPAPIPVFQYLGPERDQVVLDHGNYEKISKYYAHGTQSRRYPETYVREKDGRTIVVSGREHENWGSTLDGGSQTLRGLGDQNHYPHHSPEPSVRVMSIDGPGQLLLASDGFTDMYYFQDLMNWFRREKDTGAGDINLELRFFQYLFETAGENDINYRHITFEGVTYPKWDDVGGVLVEFTN